MKRGHHHLATKERTNQGKLALLIDRTVLICAFLAPLIELPQLIEIYTNKAAQNVSLVTWSCFVIFGIPWLIYGIIHKEKPIIILYSLWVAIDFLIVIVILMYS